MATILRAPVLSSYPARKSQPTEVWPNLLLSTLAVVAAAPLKPVQLDNPRTRPVWGQTELAQMPLALRLAPAQMLPVGTNGYDEWAQPRLIYRPQDTNSANALIRILIPAQILPVGTNGYDEWCQPRGRNGAQADSQANLLTSTLAVVATSSIFQQFDFTQPVKGKSGQVDVSPNVLIRDLAPAQLLPVGTNGEDLTQISRRTQPQTDVLPNLLASTLASTQQVLPPGQILDFRQGRKPVATQETTPTVNLLSSTLGLTPGPFIPADTAQQGASIRAQDTQASNALLQLLPPGLALLPFLSVDFTQSVKGKFAQADALPNVLIRDLVPAQLFPVGTNGEDLTQVSRRTSVQTETTPNLLASTLAPQQQVLPPGQMPDLSQWRRPIAPQDTQPQNVLIRDLAPLPLPFVAMPDWSQSRKAGAPQDTSTYQSILYQAAVAVAPFRPIDTTQAVRRTGAQADASPNLLTSTLRVIGPLPFVAADWTIIPSKRPGPQDTNVGNWIFQNAPPPVGLATVPTVRFMLGDYPQRIVLTGTATLIVLN